MKIHVSQRKTIDHQRELLMTYDPNKFFYLPEYLRTELRTMGYLDRKFNKDELINVLEYLIIDMSWTSGWVKKNDRTWLEKQLILNHKSAIRYVIYACEGIPITRYIVQTIHSILSENLFKNPSNRGMIRDTSFSIEDSIYTKNLFRQELEEVFHLMSNKLCEIKDPIEASFFVLANIPYLQPFVNFNKRTALIVSNIPLIFNDLYPIAFINAGREQHYRAIFNLYIKKEYGLLIDVFKDMYKGSIEKCKMFCNTAPSPF